MRMPSQLSFPVDHPSLEPTLGNFYQDFSPALELVEEGYHGPMDAEGVPLVDLGVTGCHYNAIIVAQYALANVPSARHGSPQHTQCLRQQANWLVRSQEQNGRRAGFWLQRFDNPKYRALRAPWVSALAQGNAISALLRAHEILGDGIYRDAAAAGYAALHLQIDEGGVRFAHEDDLWLEEYPMSPPRHVLNGAVYALLGVLDLARLTGDTSAWSTWEAGWRTVARHLDRFDTGFWSRYELASPELVDLHYHRNIHIPQLQVLAVLTGDTRFAAMATRWRRYVSSTSSLVRRRLEGRVRWWLTKREAR